MSIAIHDFQYQGIVRPVLDGVDHNTGESMKNSSNRTITSLSFMAMFVVGIPACVADMDGEAAPTVESSPIASRVVVRSAAGARAADIQGAVDQFRIDVGEGNNKDLAGTQPTGHREITWDNEPAEVSSPNDFPGDTFLRRGCLMSSPGVKLQVSTKAAEAAQAAPLFGNLNSNFPRKFNVFSVEKLFAPVDSTITELTFTVPGSETRATVNGFGTVFTDVDLTKFSKVDYFDESGVKIRTEFAKPVPNHEKSLSFVGVTFTNGQRISKVVITSGNVNLSSGTRDDALNDVVALDDFIYGEPAIAAAEN
jgi:hypothetical protein